MNEHYPTAQDMVDASNELRKLRLDNLRMQAAMMEAYGHLWHVNNEPMTPAPLYSPERAAYEARKILRDLLTHEQRGIAINAVRAEFLAPLFKS